MVINVKSGVVIYLKVFAKCFDKFKNFLIAKINAKRKCDRGILHDIDVDIID